MTRLKSPLGGTLVMAGVALALVILCAPLGNAVLHWGRGQLVGFGKELDEAFDEAPRGEGSPTVGIPRRVEGLILPGPELEAKPLVDRRGKVVVRIVETYKHGDGFRYDLSYYGLEPGRYDLRDYIQRKDRSGTADLPAIPVVVTSALKDPGQIEPNRPGLVASLFRSRYRLTMFGLAALWVAGLALILLGWRRKPSIAAVAVARRPPTLAERIRPLVARARDGTLGPGERAELERTLIDYWRRRLNLEDLPPAEAIARIKADGDAGDLLRALEAWLHMPPGEAEAVELDALLGPYERTPEPGTPIASPASRMEVPA